MSLKFALIGVGYVAPRHMQAIKDVGGELVAALDPHDSVGILDRYFPRCLYFREPERFERWLYKHPVDYVSVCSPNYLHDAHCMMAMRNGASVICEKPLTITERNLEPLLEMERDTGTKVYTVLQCRLHSEAVRAKKAYTEGPYLVRVDYVTPRGPWYRYSWKGDVEKSGGIITNIGIHLFDLCYWMFGKADDIGKKTVHFENATVNWCLGIDGSFPRRRFLVGTNPVDLTFGFNNLHTKSYREIMKGHGFGIEDARESIRIVEALR